MIYEPTTAEPTLRQRRVAEEIVSGTETTAKDLLVKVGYSELTARAKSAEVLNSGGVKRALADLGMSEDVAAGVVREIMTNKDAPPSARLTATDQTFKVHGTYAPIKTESVSLEIDLGELETLRGMADTMADRMRATEVNIEPRTKPEDNAPSVV